MYYKYLPGFILIFGLLYCSSAPKEEEEKVPVENETQITLPKEEQLPAKQQLAPPPPTEVKKEPNLVFEEMEKVYFLQGSTSLNLKNMFLLDDYIKYLKENPSVNIQLNGYTDYTSNQEINHIISQMRADSVRDYLIQNGIAPKRVLAKGLGVYNPKSPSRDPEGMKKSRTVEFTAR